jgi:hypothetical protein
VTWLEPGQAGPRDKVGPDEHERGRFHPVPLRFSAQLVDGPTGDTLAGLGTVFHDRSRSVPAQGNSS